MIPLIYRAGYNITAFGLERLHPFDSQKYGKIQRELIRLGHRKRHQFIRPRAVLRSELLRVHTALYLKSLRSSLSLARILEVPIVARLPAPLVNWRILKPMRQATSGTVLAARLALRHGLAINLGGGFHHAEADSGSGFCVYADLPLAAKLLKDEGQIERVLVVDLDAHQGDGTAAIFANWSWAAILDIYNDDIFPAVKQPEEFALPIRAGTTGPKYLALLKTELPLALHLVKPQLVLYNAGSDVFEDDPLGLLSLSAADIVARDLFVVETVRAQQIPMAMVLSGGYTAQSWKLHADSISQILKAFDRSTPN